MGEYFTGVRVFSATKAEERARLGDVVTAWLQRNPAMEVADKIVVQSSDETFHCLTIVLFVKPRAGEVSPEPVKREGA